MLLTAVPLMTVGVASWRQSAAMSAVAANGSNELAEAILDRIALDVHAACESYRTALESRTRMGLNVVTHLVEQQGGITLSNTSPREWQAVNQLTQASQTVQLPAISIGGVPLERVTRADVPVPLVDAAGNATGGRVTVFQRMNAHGDMLRVATNIIAASGSRAVGTFIPAT
ncbi:MAG TPA: Cache 3/Cache 2 fusion domain-containing protein, partial [Tepidisphaeraceae bacterium]|nr:Cache 3/Cache 2 fusion domain-containing protein [Tepidisphaeraceae bacterium]